MDGDSDLDKLEELSERIRKAQEASNPAAKESDPRLTAANRNAIKFIRVGSDFVALIVLSVILGLYLDRAWDTAPWVMVFLLVVAFVAGLWMMVRVLSPNASEEEKTEAKGGKE